MSDHRRDVFFNIGVMYAGQGLSLAEMEHALREVAGSDERLLEKIPEVMDCQVATRDNRANVHYIHADHAGVLRQEWT
jgi:hypothetical protein